MSLNTTAESACLMRRSPSRTASSLRVSLRVKAPPLWPAAAAAAARAALASAENGEGLVAERALPVGGEGVDEDAAAALGRPNSDGWDAGWVGCAGWAAGPLGKACGLQLNDAEGGGALAW